MCPSKRALADVGWDTPLTLVFLPLSLPFCSPVMRSENVTLSTLPLCQRKSSNRPNINWDCFVKACVSEKVGLLIVLENGT